VITERIKGTQWWTRGFSVTDEELLEEDIRACLNMEPAHVFAVIFRDQCCMFYISLFELQIYIDSYLRVEAYFVGFRDQLDFELFSPEFWKRRK